MSQLFGFLAFPDCQWVGWGCNVNALNSFFNHPPMPGLQTSSDDSKDPLSVWKIPLVFYTLFFKLLKGQQVFQYMNPIGPFHLAWSNPAYSFSGVVRQFCFSFFFLWIHQMGFDASFVGLSVEEIGQEGRIVMHWVWAPF